MGKSSEDLTEIKAMGFGRLENDLEVGNVHAKGSGQIGEAAGTLSLSL